GCGEFGWQTHGKLGIENHQFCQQFRMKQNGLAMRRLQCDHGTSANLTAGTGSGWDGNKWRKARPIAFVVECRKIQFRPFHKQPRGFSRVQWASTTYGNDTITVVFTIT